MSDEVIVTRSGDVLLARLNRPNMRNALDDATLTGLFGALDEAEATGARAVVLTGGDAYFSSGGDVRSMPGPDAGLFGPARRLDRIHALIERLSGADLPVVAAVEGYAVGAALGVVLACDLVVAAEDARFMVPFAARGLTADAGAAWHLTRRLGHQRAAAHLLLGEPLPATEAHRVGLVTRLVPAGTVTEAALELAGRLGSGPRESNAVTKSLMVRAAADELRSFLDVERLGVSLAGHGGDSREGRLAFIEKRKPNFL
jgi:2-(1,2-epoxy-1,2-dihydrophenyl)acetyl-CoA isomerase